MSLTRSLSFNWQPGCECTFWRISAYELLVHLGSPLQAVQGMLQFIHELVGLSSKTGGVTGGLQVGDAPIWFPFA